METFEVSIPAMPPGLPRLFRQRLEEIGPGEPVDRERLKDVCGSTSAANHFLDKATDKGALVPVAWGEYRVAQAKTLAQISRIENPPLQRFISWALELPNLVEEAVLFVAPWLWRDTDLNVSDPMPVIPLDPHDEVVHGAPPQWAAFHMDLEEQRDWRLLLGEDEVGRFSTPGLMEVTVILKMAFDPRWDEAAEQLPGGRDAERLHHEMNRLQIREAPRGSKHIRTGNGLPSRRRLLAPPWYIQKSHDNVASQTAGTRGSS